MKKYRLYLYLLVAVLPMASCKKNSVPAEIIPEVIAPVVVEDPNYLTVANTIEVSAVLEGAKFVWQNEAKKAVSIKIRYAEDGISKEQTIENNLDVAGTVTVPISSLTNFTLLVSNTNGKATATKLMGILPILKPESKLSKSGWSATASSEINDPDEELNGANNIVDAVTVKSITSPSSPSFWQSDYYLDPIYPYPHWLLVDMKKASKITKVGLNAHVDANQGFNSFKIEGSVDGAVFADIGNGVKTFNPALLTEQNYTVSTPVSIRYVKITLLTGSPYPCLANFEAYARQ
ncbi:discoidin domain-containing protein [Pedobacter sp. GR22-6]|uniref:discoidin domain-containing protein n=1 Tax=Pedobacter sp. GR22-6 TaxID=3127957 RepID=UPI00307F7348